MTELNSLLLMVCHEAVIHEGFVSLKMNDVKSNENNGDHYFLNTGSPHYVKFVDDVNSYNVFEEGKKIRNNERFAEEGTNVNFIEKKEDSVFVRTYERGVEMKLYLAAPALLRPHWLQPSAVLLPEKTIAKSQL